MVDAGVQVVCCVIMDVLLPMVDPVRNLCERAVLMDDGGGSRPTEVEMDGVAVYLSSHHTRAAQGCVRAYVRRRRP